MEDINMSEQYLQKPYRSKFVSIYNFISPALKIFGLNAKKDINFNRLHDIAKKATGLSDFGDTDYHEPLNLLIKDILNQKHFHAFGYVIAKGMLVEALKNRLYLEEAFKRNPHIEQEKINDAIWILGLPRTGSTLLHHLLSLDDNNRTLKRWEASCSSPILQDKEEDIKKRKEKAQATDKVLHALVPDLLKKHSMRWDLPDECVMLFKDTFKSQLFGFSLGLPTYGEWLLEQDLAPEYQYYVKQLKVLQSVDKRDRWVFKAPFHSLNVAAIESTFSEPKFINLHRNPNSVLPSVASLSESLQGLCLNYIDRKFIGKRALNDCKMAIDNVSEARNAIANDRMIDINFSDFIKDPAGTIEGIYKKWNIPFTEEFRQKINQFMEENPKNKHGEHKYAREEYGLTDSQIDEKFGNYISSIS